MGFNIFFLLYFGLRVGAVSNPRPFRSSVRDLCPLPPVHRRQRQAVVLAGGELRGGLLHGASGLRVRVPEQELAR